MRGEGVPRPHKKNEYVVVFGSRGSAEGWRDLEATKLNALVDAWDFLTRNPQERSVVCHELRGDLATVAHSGATHAQWQLELPGGARIWYCVTRAAGKKPGEVTLTRVSTHHPHATK